MARMVDLETYEAREATFVCEVPRSLGKVTRLYSRGGKVIAETESGIEFIVPIGNRCG